MKKKMQAGGVASKSKAADRIAGAKKNSGKAMYGKTIKAKSGAKMSMKKCKSGC